METGQVNKYLFQLFNFYSMNVTDQDFQEIYRLQEELNDQKVEQIFKKYQKPHEEYGKIIEEEDVLDYKKDLEKALNNQK